jgi:hypothetical protein
MIFGWLKQNAVNNEGRRILKKDKQGFWFKDYAKE